MTEAEWFTSEDPGTMYSILGTSGTPTGHADLSCRKIRLFTAAGFRRLLGHGDPGASTCQLAAIEALERFADDNEGDLAERWGASQLPRPRVAIATNTGGRIHASLLLRYPMPWMKAGLARLLRDIVVNPFRPVALAREFRQCCGRKWPAAEGPQDCPNCGDLAACGVIFADYITLQAMSLAHAAYDSRDPQTGHLDPLALAAVADALEEAGCVRQHCTHCVGGVWGEYESGEPIYCNDCPNRCILAHLRSPGPHVRGCWAVDLILGRE
jgi:hypothetical protein